MTRHVLELLIGATVILAVAFVFSAPPARACETMRASWYGTESGTHTATKERFTGREMTAAMPSRKFLGRVYDVVYKGRKVRVRINDLGPAARLKRGIDLSQAAFAKLAHPDVGVISVCITRVR